MTDYKVGNLQIVFNAVDETSKAFNALARNLKAIKSAVYDIGNIGTTEIDKFGKAITDIQIKFAPLLDDINGASGALKDFNELTQKLGISKVADVAQAFKELTAEAEETKNSIADLTGLIPETGENIDKVVTKSTTGFQDLNLELLATQQQLKLLNSQYAKAFKANANVNVIGQQIIDTKQKIEGLKEEIKRLNSTPVELSEVSDELEKADEKAKKTTSSFSKFFASLKRIALYRAIRTVLSSITGAFKEGVSSLANFDKGFNQTMSQITTSLTVIKTSLGSIVMPILTAIAPVLQQIAVGFANLGNVINASMAKMKGLATYTKINTDKMLEYGKASKGVLLDFDKFRSLGGQEDSILSEESIESLNEELGNTKWQYQGIYFLIQSIGDLLASILKLINTIANSTAFKTIMGVISYIVGGLTKAVSWLIDILDKSGLIEPILWGIVAVLGYIAATKIITWLSNGAIIKWIKTVISLLKEDFRGTLKLLGEDLLKLFATNQALVASVGALAGAIAYFISNLGEMNSIAKITIPIVAVLAATFTGLAVAKAAAAAGIAAPIKAAITAAALAAAITFAAGTAIAVGVGKYADGGVPNKGTLFFAGEAGAETVTVGSSGRTEVTNVSQMEEALYNALVRYGRSQSRSGDGGAINISIDGQKVFEATRRTALKRGLDFKRV